MPIDKIDSTKYFMQVNHSERTQQNESNAGAVQDEEKSNAAKYMIGATALATTIALGVIGHKNNWWKSVAKLSEKNSSKINEGSSHSSKNHSIPVAAPNHADLGTSVHGSEGINITGTSRGKKKKQSIVKEFLTSPFKTIKKRREEAKVRKRLEQVAEAKRKAEERARDIAKSAARRARERQEIIDDTPYRLNRIKADEKKYADRIERISQEDFGKIEDLGDDMYSVVKPSLSDTNPEAFAPLPKRGEYSLNNFAVDGYWNGPGGIGACQRSYIKGLELSYNNQFTIEENLRVNSHWGMMKSVALKSNDRLYHRGTVLNFSCKKLATEHARPLGWNIFIEGDISPNKMEEIRKHLVDSGTWARQLAMQNEDTMIEVFNEIIKVLNR